MENEKNGIYWYDNFINILRNTYISNEKNISRESLPKKYIRNSEQIAQNKFKELLVSNIYYAVEYYVRNELIKEQTTIFGVKTKIISCNNVDGKFVGWKAIRTSDKKIWCINAEGKREFRSIEKCNLDGYHIFLATNEHCFYKLTKKQGDVIRFYAQFAD